MGLDDIVNQAKDALGMSQQKADEAAAGDNEAATAKATEASGLMDKAKELLTDERIDQASAAIQSKTPDNVDTMVQGVADKAKDWNNPA